MVTRGEEEDVNKLHVVLSEFPTFLHRFALRVVLA